MKDTDLLSFGPKALKSMGEASLERNCSMAFGLSNGSVKVSNYSACHGGLKAYYNHNIEKDKHPVAIISRIQTRSKGYEQKERGGLLSKIPFLEYYDFLFNKSTFKDCFVTKDPERIKMEGVVVRCDDVPANMTAAACVSIRRGWEFPRVPMSLLKMLKLGVEPYKAEICSYLFSFNEQDNIVPDHFGDHQAIYSYKFKGDSVKNFKKGVVGSTEIVVNRAIGRGEYEEVYPNIVPYSKTKHYSGLGMMWNDRVRFGRSFDFKSTVSVEDEQPSYDPFNIIRRVTRQNGPNIRETIDNEFERVTRK